MHSVTRFLAAAAAIGGLSAPLAAQAPYAYPQQGYPQQAYPGYQQQAYGYGQQGYATKTRSARSSISCSVTATM